MKLKEKRILIAHFRVGKTDGVSIEIENWKKILQSHGANVALCSGPINKGANFIIDELEQQLNPEIYKIDENSFGGLKDYKSKVKLKDDIQDIQKRIKEKFTKIIKKFKPTNIIISNIFCVGEGLSAAGAITNVLDSYKVPTLLIHHDFYWENNRYNFVSTNFIKDQLKEFFPPKRSYIRHCCINSIGQEELFKRKGIKASLLHDTFDFDMKPWDQTPSISKFLKKNDVNFKKDIIMLQATRIVRRKNIEIAIDLAGELIKKQNVKKLERQSLYNNKNFDGKENNIVLLLSGYAEKRDNRYFEKLLKYAKRKKVKLIHLGKRLHKNYELFDIYPYADLITFPSQYEGFGNQLLEAFFARKPVALFEYPVFKRDIEPKGFEYLSLGDKATCGRNGMIEIPRETLKNAAERTVEILTDQSKYKQLTARNFDLGKKYFSFDSAWKVFRKYLK